MKTSELSALLSLSLILQKIMKFLKCLTYNFNLLLTGIMVTFDQCDQNKKGMDQDVIDGPYFVL